jgi:hypothetical protein
MPATTQQTLAPTSFRKNNNVSSRVAPRGFSTFDAVTATALLWFSTLSHAELSTLLFRLSVLVSVIGTACACAPDAMILRNSPNGALENEDE